MRQRNGVARERSHHRIGVWAAILSSAFSSISVIFQSQSIALLSAAIVTSMALILGSTFVFLFSGITKRLPTLNEIRRHQRGLALLITLRCILGNFLFVYALSLTSGIKAMFFTKAEPYFVLFWSWVLGRGGGNRKHFLLLFLHIMAAIILSTGGELTLGKAQLGDLLILLAMACSGLSYFVGSDVSQSFGALNTNMISQFIGGMLLLPIALLISPLSSWYANPIGWGYLLIHVLCFNVLALTLWFSALKSVEGWIVSALRAVGPLVAAPLAWVILGETLNLIQIIAGGIVLITSALIAREHFVSRIKSTKE